MFWIAAPATPPDGTTGETTSYPTKQPEDGCQVVGYSQSAKPASWQVAGYRNDDVFWISACPKDSFILRPSKDGNDVPVFYFPCPVTNDAVLSSIMEN